MNVTFRQGIVRSQTPFLQKTGNTIQLLTTSVPLVVTCSYGSNEYTFTEPLNQGTTSAWNDLPISGDYWLYLDYNKLTGQRTFGFTTNLPVFGTDTPQDPIIDQHWFNTVNNMMLVWNGSIWSSHIRIFVAKVLNATVVQENLKGSQVGLVQSYASGRVLFDGFGKAIRKSDGTFLSTEDQWFVDGSNIQASRLEADLSTALADESIPQFSVVTLSDFDRVRLADYEDTESGVLAIAMNSGIYDDQINIVFQGKVTNPNWNWSSVNETLWVDVDGSLTNVDPHGLNSSRDKQVPIARVISGDSIFFEQGLGGVGKTGPRGISGTGAELASVSSPGIARLTAYPTDPSDPIAVGSNDPRLTDTRVPSAHTHAAVQVTSSGFGYLTATNVQLNLQELYEQKLNLTGGALSGFLTLSSDPQIALHAATKQYVDSIVSGLVWVDPICLVNLISDSVNSPPSSPNSSDVYIVPVGATGIWSGLVGHMVQWNGTSWNDLGDFLTGPGSENRRFGVSMETPTVPSGTFLNHQNHIALWNHSTGTWSFYTPVNSTAVYVCNELSLHKFHQYVYDGLRNVWIEFGGTQAIVAGNQLVFNGNVLEVMEGPGSGLDSDTLDGFHSTYFSPTTHNHDSVYVNQLGGTMTGALTINSSTALNINGVSNFYDDVNVIGSDMLINSGTVQVSRDPVLPLEVATKQYVDNSTITNIPYDMAFFIGGEIDIPDSILGSYLSTRMISINMLFTGSLAITNNTSLVSTSLLIKHNGNHIGNISFSAGNNQGTLSPSSPPSADFVLQIGDRLDIVSPSALGGSLGLTDTVITIIGCSAISSCSYSPPSGDGVPR